MPYGRTTGVVRNSSRLTIRFTSNGREVDPYAIEKVQIIDTDQTTVLEIITTVVRVETGVYYVDTSADVLDAAGTYYDKWYFTWDLGNPQTTKIETFVVYGKSASAEGKAGNRLPPNNYTCEWISGINAIKVTLNKEVPDNARYLIKIRKGLPAADPVLSLRENTYLVYYSQTFTPMYETWQRVMSNVEGFVGEFNIGAVKSILVLVSEDAKKMYESQRGVGKTFNETDPPEYIQRYVRCKTKWIVLKNAVMERAKLTGISKQLGDFEVTYKADFLKALDPYLAELESCIEEYGDYVYNDGKHVTPQVGTRAKDDIRHPIRYWSWMRLPALRSTSYGEGVLKTTAPTPFITDDAVSDNIFTGGFYITS